MSTNFLLTTCQWRVWWHFLSHVLFLSFTDRKIPVSGYFPQTWGPLYKKTTEQKKKKSFSSSQYNGSTRTRNVDVLAKNTAGSGCQIGLLCLLDTWMTPLYQYGHVFSFSKTVFLLLLDRRERLNAQDGGKTVETGGSVLFFFSLSISLSFSRVSRWLPRWSLTRNNLMMKWWRLL